MKVVAIGMNNEDSHAEVAAIRKFLRRLKNSNHPIPQGLRLLVWRRMANGSYGPSKPCASCLHYMVTVFNRAFLSITSIGFSHVHNNRVGIMFSNLSLLRKAPQHYGHKQRL